MPAVAKQLLVLRHAKSSWDDPGLDDHERPLAPRGRRAARVIADHLREEQLVPALVLCSSARRTRETLAIVAPEAETAIEQDLYAASVTGVLERLRRVPSGTASVMVVGHNPALQSLVLQLGGDATDDGGSRALADGSLRALARKFPTGALATLTFSCDWSALHTGCARLTAFVRPRDLEDRRRR